MLQQTARRLSRVINVEFKAIKNISGSELKWSQHKLIRRTDGRNV
jgi:hypothetical protein